MPFILGCPLLTRGANVWIILGCMKRLSVTMKMIKDKRGRRVEEDKRSVKGRRVGDKRAGSTSN